MLSFNLLVIFTIKSNDSVSFLFLFPCFRFLHQGPNSFFSIKGNSPSERQISRVVSRDF